MIVGDWVRRPGRRAKFHLVKSVIEGAAITRCGRRMEPRLPDGTALDVSAVMPLTRLMNQPQLCKGGCE